MTTYNFNKKNKIAQRLSMLYSNTEALISRYYNLYIIDADEELNLQQYNNSACITEAKIPNRNLVLNKAVYSGTIDPYNNIDGTISQFYINTTNKSVWVCTRNGKKGWIRVLTDWELEDHDYSTEAHKGIIALVAGEATKYFDVKNVKKVIYKDYREGLNYTKVGNPNITMDGLVSGFTVNDYLTIGDLPSTGNDFGFDTEVKISALEGYKLYAWLFGDTNYYTFSETPSVGDSVYDSTGALTQYKVVSYDADTGLTIDYNSLNA